MSGGPILGRRRPYARDSVKLYDFRRPDKFSKEQIRSVEIIHETYARLAATRLAQRLHLPCSMKVGLVDQMTFQEFMGSLAGPTVLAVGSLKPLKGAAVLHLDLAAREAILDRLYGAVLGAGAAGTAANAGAGPAARDITDIECGTLEFLLGGLLAELGPAWEPVERLEPKFLNLETEPSFCQIVPPTEMILLVGLDLELGGLPGRIHLVYPYLAIEPLVPRLSAQHWYSLARLAGAPGAAAGPGASAAAAWRIENPAELVFRGETLSIAELRALRKGSLVALPGLDAGEGSLRSGGTKVLALRLRETGREGRLHLDVVEGGAGTPPPLPAEGEGGGQPLGAALAGLERGLAALRAGMEGSIAGLADGLRRLEGRQEDLGDRLLYGGSEEREPARRAAESRPFASLSSSPDSLLAAFLAGERAQLVALVLSWLDDALAARVLDGLPPELQTESVRRLRAMESVLPEVLALVERILAFKLDSLRGDRPAPGGLPKIVGLLNLVPRATEKHVVESLERLEPGLAEEIKRNMFVFEDLSLLDDESLGTVAAAAEERDLLLALKPVPEALRERIFARIGERLGEAGLARLRGEYGRIGRVRLSEADAAGMRVVALVRSLEEEGRIFIGREGEGA